MPRVPEAGDTFRDRSSIIDVPQYGGRQVAAKAIPGERLGATLSGQGAAAVGQGLADVGAAVLKVKRQADDLRVVSATNDLTTMETALLHDPEKGALNRRGPAAFDTDSPLQEFDRRAAEIEQGLANPEQQAAFRRAATSQRTLIDRQLAEHSSREFARFTAEETASFIANEIDAGIAGYQNPVRSEAAIARANGALVLQARTQGHGVEWLDTRTVEVKTKVYAGVIDRLLANNQDLAARDYYGQVKDDITGDAQARIEKALQLGGLRGESQRQADRILVQHRDLGTAVQAARAIADPEVRDATESRVKDYFSTQKTAEAERRHDAYLGAHQLLEKNGGNLDRIPPATLATLDPAQRTSLETRSRQIREGVEPAQDDKTWVNFLDLDARTLAAMSSAELLSKYRPYLDNAHWNRAAELWQAARTGKNTDKLTAALTFKDRIDNGLRTAGVIDPNKTRAKFSDDEARLYARFETEAARALEHFELTALGGKRKASGEEQQKVVDELLLRKVFVERTLRRDPKRPVALLEADERARAYVPLAKIPQAELATLRNLILSKRRQVTNDKLQRAYAAYLIDDRRAFDAILGE